MTGYESDAFNQIYALLAQLKSDLKVKVNCNTVTEHDEPILVYPKIED